MFEIRAGEACKSAFYRLFAVSVSSIICLLVAVIVATVAEFVFYLSFQHFFYELAHERLDGLLPNLCLIFAYTLTILFGESPKLFSRKTFLLLNMSPF